MYVLYRRFTVHVLVVNVRQLTNGIYRGMEIFHVRKNWWISVFIGIHGVMSMHLSVTIQFQFFMDKIFKEQ